MFARKLLHNSLRAVLLIFVMCPCRACPACFLFFPTTFDSWKANLASAGTEGKESRRTTSTREARAFLPALLEELRFNSKPETSWIIINPYRCAPNTRSTDEIQLDRNIASARVCFGYRIVRGWIRCMCCARLC